MSAGAARAAVVAMVTVVAGACAAPDEEGPAPERDERAETSVIEGAVVSYPEGEPLAGIPVLVVDVRARYRYVYTEEDGSYRAEGLDAWFYRLKAWPLDDQNFIGAYYDDTYFYCTGTLVDLRDEDHVAGVDFRLPHGGALEGTITDAVTGEPLEGARVDLRGVDYYNTNIDPSVTTGEDGTFRLVGLDSAYDNAVDMNPVPGNYELKVTVGGRPVVYWPGVYSTADVEYVEAMRGETRTGVDLAIPAGATIEGTAVGPDGQPLSGGAVYLRHTTDTWIQTNVSIGTDGVFQATGLAPGAYALELSASGLATTIPSEAVEVAEDGLADGLVFQLETESTLSGTLSGGVSPLPGASVRASNPTTGQGEGATTDEDGAFTIDSLAAGTYLLYVAPADDAFAAGYLCGEGLCQGSSEATEIALGTGEDRDLGALDVPPAGVIAGRVVERYTGLPLERIYVTIFPAEGEGATSTDVTDADGAFRFGGLTGPGYQLMAEPYRYCISDPGWVTTYSGDARRVEDAAVIEPVPGAEVQVEITMPRDHDGDGMEDLWEFDFQLDTTRDDGLEDADLDGVTNLDEYLMDTNPRDGGGAGGGCSGAPGSGTPAATLVLGLVVLARRRRHGGHGSR